MGAYQDLIASPANILSSLNPHSGFSSSNCPATAAAVAQYLDTGQIAPASGNFGTGFIIVEERESHPAGNISTILHRLAHISGEGRLVVYGTDQSSTDSDEGHHHFFVLLKSGGELYYADAYTRPPVFAAGEAAIRGRCSWIRSFLYWTGGFHVRPGR